MIKINGNNSFANEKIYSFYISIRKKALILPKMHFLLETVFTQRKKNCFILSNCRYNVIIKFIATKVFSIKKSQYLHFYQKKGVCTTKY